MSKYKIQDNKIAFLGSSSFGVYILQELVKEFDVHVITTEPKIANRNKLTYSCLERWARKNNIHVSYDLSSVLEYEVAIMSAYGKYIPSKIFNDVPVMLNTHPSLLPKYRGASPMQYTILNNDEYAGVSIITMHKNIDAGRIVKQEKIKLNQMRYTDLSNELSKIAWGCYREILQDPYIALQNSYEQIGEVTMANKIAKHEAMLSFENQNCVELGGKINAFCEWPKAWTETQHGERFIILSCKYEVKSHNYKPGYVSLNEERPFIACKDGLVFPEIIQKPGKNPIGVKEFRLGNQLEFVK